jgi:catechol 2,3-dioxygenase
MLNATARPWRRGASPRRLDHANITALDIEAAERFHAEVLGFGVRERMRQGADGPLFVTWMSVTSLAHDIAIAAEQGPRDGQFHHLAFAVESYDDVLRAADIFSRRRA